MKNIPNKIYLQVDEYANDADNFNELAEVSWCKDRINKTDIVYYRKKKNLQEFMQEWEKKNNPFYPNEMRWDREKINKMLSEYK